MNSTSSEQLIVFMLLLGAGAQSTPREGNGEEGFERDANRKRALFFPLAQRRKQKVDPKLLRLRNRLLLARPNTTCSARGLPDGSDPRSLIDTIYLHTQLVFNGTSFGRTPVEVQEMPLEVMERETLVGTFPFVSGNMWDNRPLRHCQRTHNYKIHITFWIIRMIVELILKCVEHTGPPFRRPTVFLPPIICTRC